MKKYLIPVIAAFIFAVNFYSCDDTETYIEQKKKENSQIKMFIEDNGITVIDTVPKSCPWPDGLYYKTEDGIYVHVLDTGKAVSKSITYNTVINIRYVEKNMDGDTTYHNMMSSDPPYEIYYGNKQTTKQFGDCKAWHEGLDYVGDGGHIEMIVPSDMGMSAYFSSTLIPAYYELRYKFWK